MYARTHKQIGTYGIDNEGTNGVFVPIDLVGLATKLLLALIICATLHFETEEPPQSSFQGLFSNDDDSSQGSVDIGGFGQESLYRPVEKEDIEEFGGGLIQDLVSEATDTEEFEDAQEFQHSQEAPRRKPPQSGRRFRKGQKCPVAPIEEDEADSRPKSQRKTFSALAKHKQQLRRDKNMPVKTRADGPPPQTPTEKEKVNASDDETVMESGSEKSTPAPANG